MPYPSLEQYTEALQSPHIAILEPELKRGTLKTTGLGLPLALCGGFALTYTVEANGKKFALRCFHKESRELEKRYAAIASKIKQLNSPYFLPFEFIREGIRIQGANYPIVKMAWAQGKTLAEFLENEHKNKGALQQLRGSLGKLADFIERNQIAHGDIQPENLMVSGNGATIQLIDYDGMFVDVLNGSKATEYGQVNFQHPKRSGDHFNQHLDRFSFICLDIAIQSLIINPQLWSISNSEPSAILFRRNDYIDPGSSAIFNEVRKLPELKNQIENLAKIASGNFGAIPSLSDFQQGKGISNVLISYGVKATASTHLYQGAYFVCDATNYQQVLAQVGNRIELIGRVHSIKPGWTQNRKRYVFINFSDWRGRAVKLAIWSDGLKDIGPNVPDDAWIGKWLSVTGLVDSPYDGQAGSVKYTHLSITINAKGQIQKLADGEARYRLGSAGQKQVMPIASSRNSDILQNMGGTAKPSTTTAPQNTSHLASKPVPQKSTNQQLLDNMRAKTPVVTQPSAHQTVSNIPLKPKSSSPGNKQAPVPKNTSWGTWIFLGVIALLVFRGCTG
ncbi:serine/threonine protein kinase [Cellvibrio mixtus]|uniref:Serine/threonine protein kinase n=1 Tax=Cellvibrio mixtus TaxID=39650 RepID=A0A266Q8U4_9GAMM|nr:protein kinase family protein [Cellvibrio mixtus]OZY86036.1 serine/threonine protein kinase [Cellvibrio mixtus]